ncbi:MAG: potassium transporter Kup [Limisphaerales bacterium]
MNSHHHRRPSAVLTLGALGITFGHLTTSPLYAFRECVSASSDPATVLGAASLIVWSLGALVSVKYLLLALRADNHGEGGILALMALATGSESRFRTLLTLAGVLGAALLFAEGTIAPSITILSALDGLRERWPSSGAFILPLTLVVLGALFAFQRRRTHRIEAAFGPMLLVWCVVLAALGIAAIARHPTVLRAIDPTLGVRFLATSGWHGVFVLGSAFLAITGAEALHADLGLFGARPIRLAWSLVVLPSLILNYLGQAALVLGDPAAAANPFFRLAPATALLPIVALATAVGMAASQARITRAFSLAVQAMQFGYLPRIDIDHTSARHREQIHIAPVNAGLGLGCLIVVAGFKSSSSLASAYGISIVLVMVLTTLLLAGVAWKHWVWPASRVGMVFGPLLAFEALLLGANLPKIALGGWLTLAFAGILLVVMLTWHRGRGVVGRRLRARLVGLNEFIDQVARDPSVRRVRGTAVFLTSNPEGTPIALAQNLKHNRVIHERVVLLCFHTSALPHVRPEERITIEKLPHGFWRVMAHFGFMEDPEIGPVREMCGHLGLAWNDFEATYFLGRESIVRSRHPVFSHWRLVLFGFLARNAQEPAAFFRLPANRVVVLGVQVDL